MTDASNVHRSFCLFGDIFRNLIQCAVQDFAQLIERIGIHIFIFPQTVKLSAAELALEALKAQKDAGAEFLNSAKEDAEKSGVAGVHAAPTNSNLDEAAQAKEDINAGANLIAGITAE